jgi:hypothetical protein
MNLRGIKNLKISGNNTLMSFKHLRMLNSASKCLKITLRLRVIKFSKPEKIFKKLKLRGNIPLKSFEGGTYPPSPSGGIPGRVIFYF